MNNPPTIEFEQKIRDLLDSLRQLNKPNPHAVHDLLLALHLFHIYDLERALISLDPRVRTAAIQRIEDLLPLLLSSNNQEKKNGIQTLEHHFEPVKMLDEDA